MTSIPPQGSHGNPAGPHFDAEGRRTDGRWLLYGEYVNVEELLRIPRVPEDVPKGRTREEWPEWPEIDAPEGGRRGRRGG